MLLVTLLEACGFAAAGETATGGTGGVLSGTGGVGGGEGVSGTGGGGTGSTTSGTGGGDGKPLSPCLDSANLVKSIATAKSGSVIKLDICTLEGPLMIPAGVTVQGLGKGMSRISSKAGGLAVQLMPGKPAARLTGVTVVSNGTAAIASWGEGSVELEEVEVQVNSGVGIAAEKLSSLSLKHVTVAGLVNDRNALSYPPEVSPKNAPTHGLVALGIGKVDLSDVSLSGLADFGALVLGSTLTWTGGGTSSTLGTGLFVGGGATTLTDVSLCGTFRGKRSRLAANGAFTGKATITSHGLTTCDGEGLGLLHVDVTATHSDLVATGNAAPGVWVQGSPSFELAGTSNVIDKNQLAGLVFVDVLKVKLANAKISNTGMAKLPFGENHASVSLGDGIQLIRSATDVWFDSVGVSENAHTGFQIDLGPNEITSPLFKMLWTGVTAESSGKAYGAVCQGSPNGVGEVWGPGVVGWDTGILRSGAAAINDGLLVDPNDRVGLVDPNDMPSPTGVLKGGGLAGLGVKGLQ
jgi:hypothetical protein